MTKRKKKTQRQIMIHKTLNRKLKIEQHESRFKKKKKDDPEL